ncbi:MAG: sulfurtransferase TusC, partial [Pseudomonas sp.]|nr:sulfurtransferase TusC [Pseudomonas sp.]
LFERGLDSSALSLPVELLDEHGLPALLQRYDLVMTL